MAEAPPEAIAEEAAAALEISDAQTDVINASPTIHRATKATRLRQGKAASR